MIEDYIHLNLFLWKHDSHFVYVFSVHKITFCFCGSDTNGTYLSEASYEICKKDEDHRRAAQKANAKLKAP